MPVGSDIGLRIRLKFPLIDGRGSLRGMIGRGRAVDQIVAGTSARPPNRRYLPDTTENM
jgi:hypothetical protein